MSFCGAHVRIVSALILLQLLLVGCESQVDSITLIELPPLAGDDYSVAYAINDAQPVQVAGVSVRRVNGGSKETAVVWAVDGEGGVDKQALTKDPSHPDYERTLAHDINDAGIAVGAALKGEASIPMRWMDGVGKNVLDFDNDGLDHHGIAYAIDDRGLIVGSCREFTQGFTVLESNGTAEVNYPSATRSLSAVDSLFAGRIENTESSEALGVGLSDPYIYLPFPEGSPNPRLSVHNMRWVQNNSSGSMRLPIGIRLRRDVVINPASALARRKTQGFVLVGASVVQRPTPVHSAVAWDISPRREATATFLPGLSSDHGGAAYGVNSARVIVGVSRPTSGGSAVFESKAVLWDPAGRIHNLNDGIATDSGWNLLQARDINDRAEVVGNGTKNGTRRAFLLRLEQPLFELIKDSPKRIYTGGTLTYTFTVVNRAADAATCRIEDELPSGTTFDQGANTGWSLDANGTTLRYTLTVPGTSTLPDPPNSSDVLLKLLVTAPAGSQIENQSYALYVDGKPQIQYYPPKITPVVANIAPTVELTARRACPWESEGGGALLHARARDNDGALLRVEFHVDGQPSPIASPTSPPFELSWNPPAPGIYTFTAHAVDDAGATTTSAAVTVALGSELPAELPSYEVKELPLPPGMRHSLALDVNDSGTIVGSVTTLATTTSQSKEFPCIWDDGLPSLLQPDLLTEPEQGRAFAVNDAGWIAGYEGKETAPRAVIWVAGERIYLDNDATHASWAENVNNAGQVLVLFPNGLAIWSAGVLSPLAVSFGAEYSLSPSYRGYTFGLNDAGQVTGYAPSSDGWERGFRWTPDGSTGILENLSPSAWGNSYGGAINRLGHVVGISGNDGPTMWTVGAPGLSFFDSDNPPHPNDMNSSGIILANRFVPTVKGYVFLCERRHEFYMLCAPETRDNWKDAYVTSINDHGQIVGNEPGRFGSERSSFLATPVGLLQ